MIWNRNQSALIFSVEKLARENRQLYFWTFTFKHTPLCDTEAMLDWNALHDRLKHHFPMLRGVRVAELHRNHGIHFHAIVNTRIPIARIKRMVKGSGFLVGRNRYLDFGRMSVTKCDSATVYYLCKYLTKQYARENQFWHRRRWGSIGGFKGTKCADIEYDSMMHRNYRRLFWPAQIPYKMWWFLTHLSETWGDYEEWPKKWKILIYMSEAAQKAKLVHDEVCPF